MSELTLRAIEAARRDYHNPDVARWMRDLARSIAAVGTEPRERQATVPHTFHCRAGTAASWK
jgi:hypothetical protein